jgi:formiminoglutamase
MSAPAHHKWLAIHHGVAPLLVSFPHTGTEIPPGVESNLASPWLARKDADYWVDVLYDFAHEMGATTLRTALSRTVIDVNRDPSGVSLYPGRPPRDCVPSKPSTANRCTRSTRA